MSARSRAGWRSVVADIIDAEIARLERNLAALKINIGQGRDGKFTAHTVTEPLFCVVRDSLDEIKVAVSDVIGSYTTTFFRVTEVNTKFIEVPVDRQTIPIESVKPISRLTPQPHLGGYTPIGPRYAVG